MGAKPRPKASRLDKGTYLNLVKPKERDPVQRLPRWKKAWRQGAQPLRGGRKMCMHHMMAIDSLGGDSLRARHGLNLPQDVCTVQTLPRWWPHLKPATHRQTIRRQHPSMSLAYDPENATPPTGRWAA